ncbi:efflux RND transporter permease subunit [Aliiglaciecola sp. 2_MG-2023]|uniref:efflux RND transporter permease subunit n=1 Tax=unclassified Aliiglaciecola TaxID=2593648 RepID=UPI0026E29440|nr:MULTISPECIES: efflux RND transporter permease subunit [unclassified Aliiglaciecola]MDO6710900.1 efflux RND transporter permease subunit [Aliiglaciecola sp. 2_MG-2023]MDO6752381.1 efflux RND transporter permease subunit [Aliiglaciecola sp. 1_MG-2023]
MLSNLIRLSLSQRIFILLMAVGVMLTGIVSWMNIPIDAFPDISPTQVKVILKAPGMTAEEIEAQVTLPVETELLGIPDQQVLRSTTKYAITDITLDFVEGTDIYWARQQVAERLNNIWTSLPADLEGGIAPMSTPLSEMFMFSLENPQLSLLERRQILEWEIRPLLRTIDGVADVNILGGFAKTYQITPDPVKLATLGLTLNQLAQQIQANNLNGNIGRLDIGNDALIIRGEGRIDTLDQLRDMGISNRLQQSIRLSDVADVSVGHLTRYGSVTRNGEETTEAIVISLKNANTARVIEGVSEKLKQIETSLPTGSQINVFYNRKNLIDTAIGTIQEALLIAVILVIIVLTLFLGNIRAALVVSMILPLAALSTFWLMNSVNMSANLMSLGGLVIAIGMLVDASVVVVENVVNQLSKKNHLPKLHLVFRACKDVAVPVVSGTIIVIIVFSPLLTLTGLEGKLFKPVAMTIVFAMFCALLLSLTVIPALASILIKQHDSAEPSFVTTLKANYRTTLSKTLARPAPLIIGILLALIASAVQFVYLGKTFMPVLDEGDIIVQLEKTPNITLTASTELDIQIQNALLEQVPEISQIVARVGADEIGLDPMSLNETDVFMELIPPAQWRFSSKSKLVDAIRDVLKQFPGINFGFTQPIQMRVSEMLTGSTGDVTIKVFGQDLTELAKLASRISEITKSTAGSVDVNTAVTEGGEFLNIRLKPEIAQRYAMSITELSSYLRSQFETVAISEIIQGKRKTPVVFATSASSAMRPGTLHEIKNNLILLPDASLVPLHEIAEISFKQGPILVERENSNRFSVVTTNVSGRDIVGFVEELKKTLANTLELPSGYVLSFGGEFENQQRATNNLMMVVPISLLLILIILFTTFGSLAKSALILVNIPFAVMGGIFALFISGQYLSVPASVGFIALLGIAVLNGVVMVSYFEQTKMEISDTLIRIIDGATRRLRPVLMTAMTAMFGLAPLVFASGPGAEIQKPLAIVVIGGLFTSTLTTLYLLPVLYNWMERRNAKTK